jgi:acetyl esterase/lipase
MMVFQCGKSLRQVTTAFQIAILALCLFGSTNKVAAAELSKGTITSQIDNQPDVFAVAVAEPGKKSGLMFVYLHGAGCDFTEPFLKPDAFPCSEALLSMYPDAILLSPNYGKQPSWGSDASLADLDAVIRRVIKDHGVNRVILIGNSMGASVALLYASVAAPDLKKVIAGVVAAQPASDLSELYNTTKLSALPPTMSAALGATPQEQPALYARKSVRNNLSSISK